MSAAPPAARRESASHPPDGDGVQGSHSAGDAGQGRDLSPVGCHDWAATVHCRELATAKARRALNLAVYLLAFVSGARLMYELTWARMLALTFGSTTLSAASVIGGFLGGMGVGAWGYHLVRAKLSRPLLVYALLELGIAATTAVLTATFYSLPETLAPVSRLVGAPLVLGVVRVTCVIALLFVPSALMGATFPRSVR